jgi:patatin-like phospholipase/acyl hydrolase
LSNFIVSYLDGSIFATLPNLQNLNLHQNNISSIDNTTFASLTKLAVLDISSNGLEHIGVGAFSKQPSTFYWLDLSNNKLKGFDKGVFDHKITNILLNGMKLLPHVAK